MSDYNTVAELGEQILSLFEDFRVNHDKNLAKNNAAAGGRARKALGEIKKLVTEYRKMSVDANK